MLRTGASFSKQFVKINRRNFEDAPHENAIFEAFKNQTTQKSMSGAGAQFLKIGVRPIRMLGPIGKLIQKEKRLIFRDYNAIKRRCFQNLRTKIFQTFKDQMQKNRFVSNRSTIFE